MRRLFLSHQIVRNVIAHLALLLIAGLAQADGVPGQGTWETTLEPRDLDGNGVTDAYYDTVLDITWLADADYKTTSGWTLHGPGLPENQFVDYLAGFAYLGVNNWRLPRIDNPNQGATGGELAHMYAVTLGNVLAPNPGATLVNTGPFVNLRSDCYQYAGMSYYSNFKYFNMIAGSDQKLTGCTRTTTGSWATRVWAVADGDVQPVHFAAPAYEIVDLGTLGGNYSTAYAINNNGQIVGEAANGANVRRAFLYTNGMMQDLGTLKTDNSGTSVAYGINDLGAITGVTAANTPVAGVGFLYSDNVMTPLGPLPASAVTYTQYIDTAKAINDNGDIAITVKELQTFERENFGVRAANGALSLTNSDRDSPVAIALNSAGHMIAKNSEGLYVVYNLLRNGQRYALGICNTDSDNVDCSSVFDINDNDQVAGSFFGSRCHPFGCEYGKFYEVWGEVITVRPDNSISHDRVPGSRAIHLINTGGDMVGVHNGRPIMRPANGPNFYLDEIADTSGWDWNYAAEGFYPSQQFFGMNDHGDIVGWARTTAGQTHAVLLRRLGPAKIVAMDVDPYSTANEILPSSDNPIPVAILSTRLSDGDGDAVDFDATQVDPASLKFGLGEASNVALPWAVDAGQDGDTDVLFAFHTQDAGIFCGDTEVSLTGETYAGELIRATDTIATTDCTDTGCHP